MTCTSQQIDLVMHQLKRHQFEALKLSSMVKEGEFYYITDDKSTENVISGILSSYYRIGSVEFQNDVSAMISADATYVYQNESKQNLNIYKIYRAEYESLKEQQLIRDDAYYYIVDDPTVEDKIEGYLSNYYQKSQTSSSIQISNEFRKYQLSGDYLLSSNLSFNYDSSTKYIYLKAFGNDIGTVNCQDFIKDGMLSTVHLCGNVLVLTFNTDAGKTPISVNLSTFVDNYDEKIRTLSSEISSLSSKVDIIGSDYLDSNDKIEMYNDLLSPEEVSLYRGPGEKDISLSVGTGTQLCVYTASLSDFYSANETEQQLMLSTHQCMTKIVTWTKIEEII